MGADITAGLLACGFDRTDRVNVLIDLGTNGEMAVGNREKIMVTSTAAGPAFEGGNISCGMGSMPGAISRVEIRGGQTGISVGKTGTSGGQAGISVGKTGTSGGKTDASGEKTVCGFDGEDVSARTDAGIESRDIVCYTTGERLSGDSSGKEKQSSCAEVRTGQGDIFCRTIGGRAPVGLCGTGVIETVYELLKNEWIDETGLLDEAYFDDGFVLAASAAGGDIRFTQKDVREVQLAKSAVRAGLETLLLRYGVTYREIGTLYLAGGFGARIDLKKAAGIGLLPEELLGKAAAVGNSALRGAAEFLRDEHAAARMEQIIQVSEEVQLAADKDFNRFYMEYMMFTV
ncbi:MAG: ATP-binding protein [Lachnospiraceae bacterium]|nr:ATP-binding protein [Lachnospiraceae bacterium]